MAPDRGASGDGVSGATGAAGFATRSPTNRTNRRPKYSRPRAASGLSQKPGSSAILAAIRRALAGCTLGAASTKMRCMAEVHGRVDPMDDDYGVISQAESDEGILAFDVSKRTASTEQQAFTWIYCTGGWQYCPA